MSNDRAAFLAKRKPLQRNYRAPYTSEARLIPRVAITVTGPQDCGKTTLIAAIREALNGLGVSASYREVQK